MTGYAGTPSLTRPAVSPGSLRHLQPGTPRTGDTHYGITLSFSAGTASATFIATSRRTGSATLRSTVAPATASADSTSFDVPTRSHPPDAHRSRRRLHRSPDRRNRVPLQVTAYDLYGNLATSYTGSPALSGLAPPPAVRTCSAVLHQPPAGRPTGPSWAPGGRPARAPVTPQHARAWPRLTGHRHRQRVQQLDLVRRRAGSPRRLHPVGSVGDRQDRGSLLRCDGDRLRRVRQPQDELPRHEHRFGQPRDGARLHSGYGRRLGADLHPILVHRAGPRGPRRRPSSRSSRRPAGRSPFPTVPAATSTPSTWSPLRRRTFSSAVTHLVRSTASPSTRSQHADLTRVQFRRARARRRPASRRRRRAVRLRTRPRP